MVACKYRDNIPARLLLSQVHGLGLLRACYRHKTPTEPAAADVQTHSLHRLLLAWTCKVHSHCCCETHWLGWHLVFARVQHSKPAEPATVAASQALAPPQAWPARHITHALDMSAEPVAVQALAPAPAWLKGALQA